MQFMASPSPRFASVMPLPSDQSEASSSEVLSDSERSDSRSSSPKSSDADALSSDCDSDAPPHQRQRYSSSSNSPVSSSLSFSATSSDADEQDVDIETPLKPHSSRHHHHRAGSYVASREMSMQAIWNADTVGFIALLIPITGISTMVLTEALACSYHFDCSKNYPTLSYAATFRPEGTAFMIGMCLTAFFIFVSSGLFYWFLRLRLGTVDARAHATSLVSFVAGVATAVTLAGLAILDMGAYHDAHIAFTVLFFIASWVLIVFCHLARRLLLLREHEHEAEKMSGSTCPTLLLGAVTGAGGRSSQASVWPALKRWRRLSIPMAFTLGRLFILAGISSTVLFGLTFLCVNGSWPNPLGFTAVQEAFFEAFAIVCQLFFMGTLSCELSMLSREVEARDYMELERRE